MTKSRSAISTPRATTSVQRSTRMVVFSVSGFEKSAMAPARSWELRSPWRMFIEIPLKTLSPIISSELTRLGAGSSFRIRFSSRRGRFPCDGCEYFWNEGQRRIEKRAW